MKNICRATYEVSYIVLPYNDVWEITYAGNLGMCKLNGQKKDAQNLNSRKNLMIKVLQK